MAEPKSERSLNRANRRAASPPNAQTNKRAARAPSASRAEQPTIKERQASLGQSKADRIKAAKKLIQSTTARGRLPRDRAPTAEENPRALPQTDKSAINKTQRRAGQAKANEPASPRRQARSAQRSNPGMICRRFAEGRAEAALGRARGGLTRFLTCFLTFEGAPGLRFFFCPFAAVDFFCLCFFFSFPGARAELGTAPRLCSFRRLQFAVCAGRLRLGAVARRAALG